MLDPEDIDKLFTEEGNIVGHIASDTGGIMLVDSIWQNSIPRVQNVVLQLDMPLRQLIPVRAIRKNGKRFLIIEIDDAETREVTAETVEIE